jgi:hypothetical protein
MGCGRVQQLQSGTAHGRVPCGDACPAIAHSQAYDGALVRLKGTTAATNFSLSQYITELSEHHQIKMVSIDQCSPFLST